MKNWERDEVIKVVSGRHMGNEFTIEDDIRNMPGADDLPTLATQGNFAARNALHIDNYMDSDVPFFYGKIKGLGYIISAYDLGLTDDRV